MHTAPRFNEFVVEVPGIAERHAGLLVRGIRPGLALEPYEPSRRDQLLVCTTEMNDRQEIDRLVRELGS